MELLVTVGPRHWGQASSEIRVGTFIHELGHNLDLDHGGDDAVNLKPGYLSIMNYAYQTTGVPRSDGSRSFGYSTVETQPLDETVLVEQDGIGPAAESWDVYWWRDGQRRQAAAGGGIDWDADGSVESAPYAADLNRSSSQETLTGPRDLDALRLDVGSKGDPSGSGSGAGEHGAVASNPMTAELHRELHG